MKLTHLIQNINKFYPQLINAFLADYCYDSDSLNPNREYHYGYGSLKWAISFLAENKEPSMVPKIFYQILLEHKALGKTEADLQYHILNYPAIYDYKKELDARTTPDIRLLRNAKIGNWLFVFNDTNTSLTSKVFRHTRADAIIFTNSVKQSAGITFRPQSKIVEEKGLLAHIFHTCQSIEPGWKQVGETLITNHGAENKTPTSVTTDIMFQIIESYYNNGLSATHCFIDEAKDTWIDLLASQHLPEQAAYGVKLIQEDNAHRLNAMAETHRQFRGHAKGLSTDHMIVDSIFDENRDPFPID
jgi:hypothetical protein